MLQRRRSTHFPAFGWPLSLSDFETKAGGTNGSTTALVIIPRARACCERLFGRGARAEKCLIVADATLRLCAASMLVCVRNDKFLGIMLVAGDIEVRMLVGYKHDHRGVVRCALRAWVG